MKAPTGTDQSSIRVFNITRGTQLASEVHIADGILSRLRGLIGRRSLEPGHGLLIAPCSSIHMFFMAFAIDVVYVNGELEVVGIDYAIKPWQVGKPRPKSRFVIELPADTTTTTETQIGDKLRLDGYTLRSPLLLLRLKPW
jgi:uncharacterized protein